MEEIKNVVGAKGGKVWSPPVPPPPASNPTLTPAIEPSPATSFFGKIFDFVRECIHVSPALFYCLVSILFIGLIQICLLFSLWVSHDEELSDAWEQEYGYQEVSVNNDFTEAEVVTAAGETLSVDALKYKGARILFESQEQLYEKIEEVESGTYPEELYQP